MNKKEISPEKCKHKNWMFIKDPKGNENGLSKCIDCNLWLTNSDRLSLEALKNQKTVSRISIILSILAIIISVLSIICK